MTFFARWESSSAKAALARAQIGNDHGRHQAQQSFGQALPRFAGNVILAQAAGDAVKEGAHFVLALFEHAAHGGLILRGFGDLGGGAGEEIIQKTSRRG